MLPGLQDSRGGRGLEMISVCIRISEHTVKTIVQGMRKISSPHPTRLVLRSASLVGCEYDIRKNFISATNQTCAREQAWLVAKMTF